VHGSGGTVLDVGRKTRVISTAMRRALRFRDKGCRFPGCTNTRWVDAHHIVHWVRGGRTDLANLILLCRHHHRVVHEGGYTIGQPRPGRFTFTRPDGTLLPHAPEPAAIDPDAGPEHLHDARIAPDTITGHWAGEHLDLGLTVARLLLTKRPTEQRAS
jgi:hypothetical protein